jgi:hypothetical protein
MGVIRMVIKPQAGAQEKFLASPADIVVYGGAAGGGKTYSLLLECLRHADTPGFNAVVFRRQANQITNAGGLWDTAINIYSQLLSPVVVAEMSPTVSNKGQSANILE